MTNPVTKDRLHYEDLSVGQVFELGPKQVTKQMIFDFAHEFDPLPFHIDEQAAKRSLLGGLAASGWHTAALSLRMLIDTFLGHAASMGGLGFTKLRWKRPVLAGDAISGTVTISELRRSVSRPKWGVVTLDFDMHNQKGQQVMTMRLNNLIEVRNPDTPGEVGS